MPFICTFEFKKYVIGYTIPGQIVLILKKLPFLIPDKEPDLSFIAFVAFIMSDLSMDLYLNR